jgi:hypothetical protein
MTDDDDGDDSRKLAAFHLHLQGPALTWSNGLAPGLDWDTIKQGFLDKYVTIGWQYPSVVIESESFQNMVLGQTQEIEDLYCQLMEKGKILSKPEEEIMLKFINGLPEKLAFDVRTSKPGNMSKALSSLLGICEFVPCTCFEPIFPVAERLLSIFANSLTCSFNSATSDVLAVTFFGVRTSKPGNMSEALSYAKTGEVYKYRAHETNHTVAAAKVTASTSEVAELKLQVSELANMLNNLSATGNMGSKG